MRNIIQIIILIGTTFTAYKAGKYYDIDILKSLYWLLVFMTLAITTQMVFCTEEIVKSIKEKQNGD